MSIYVYQDTIHNYILPNLLLIFFANTIFNITKGANATLIIAALFSHKLAIMIVVNNLFNRCVLHWNP